MMKKSRKSSRGLLSTERLLLAGGDARMRIDPVTGQNQYGCQALPDQDLLAFGSSTASTISEAGFAAANRLRNQLLKSIRRKSVMAVYATEMARIEREWRELCGLSDFNGLELIFSSSGTDIHRIASRYAYGTPAAPALAVMVEANETGSGVLTALSDQAENPGNAVEIMPLAIRLVDGGLRSLADIEQELNAAVSVAVATDRRVLLILVDQSKTGLIAPSPACAMALKQRYPHHVEVLVDACQFRIAPSTLRAYLQQGFMVALTGSKFLSGPAFSAVLMLPENVKQHHHPLVRCTAKSDPARLAQVERRMPMANFGLLLRLEAALEELRRFRAVPQKVALEFMTAFAAAVKHRLDSDLHFESLPVSPLNRFPLVSAQDWDYIQTIFPFILCFPRSSVEGKPLNQAETLAVYQQLRLNQALTSSRCQLGQPVACGTRNTVAIYALRLCLSSRLIVEASQSADQGAAIIAAALSVLDKTALLIQLAISPVLRDNVMKAVA